MNERTETYLIQHPENRTHFEKLYQLIDNLKQHGNATLTVTSTEIGHTTTLTRHMDNSKVEVSFFTYNNVDHPTLLIFGKETYSFEPSEILSINIEQFSDSAGMRYTLELLQSHNQYAMQFDLT